MAVLSLAHPVTLTLFAIFPFIANGNVMRLFAPNPPDFVTITDLKSEMQSLVEKLGNRLRCDDHGLEISECVKCIDSDNLIQLLKLDPSSKSLSRQNAEEIAVMLGHQMLYFESMCVSKSNGCVDYQDCQEEVLEVMGRYSTTRESLVKILRIFKMYLKEENGKQCLNADQILSETPPNYDDRDAVRETRRIFAVVMGRLFEGYCIDAGESTTDFLDDIFYHYGDTCSPYMNLNGLKKMMHDLQSGQGNDHDHNHHHDHHHDNDHEHNHDCEHTHGEYSHYHSHGDHSHHGPHYDRHFEYEHKDSLGHDHSHHNHMHPIEYDRPESLVGDEKSTLEEATNRTNSPNYEVKLNMTDITVTSGSENRTDETTFYSPALSEDLPSSDTFMNIKEKMANLSPESTLVERIPRVRRSKEQKRSTEDLIEEFNQPARSLRSEFSLPEDTHHIEMNHRHVPLDDVKKVYLLENEEHNRNVELSGTPHQFASLANKCLSAEELIVKFGHHVNGSISKDDFIEICPALIQQIVSGVCSDPVSPPGLLPTKAEVYGYGTLSVFIISLTSLAGVLLLPIMAKQVYSYIISGFCGLAFSTLAADALLHLIPQFLGLHTHGPGEDHGHSHDEVFLEPYVQLQLGVFFTIYALFLFESVMSAFSGPSHHSHENKGHGHSHAHLPDELPTLMSVKTKSETQLPVSRDQSTSSLDTEIVEVEAMKKPPNLMVTKPVFLGLTSMAIMVTIGDSIHNFGDGLAIGAAFSTGVRGGLSTAIAVLFHELPHEFGDFVVLLSTGLSFSKALWINFLSGLTCFGGLYLGILIGDNEVARKWVMAITAGIFLYVALGEMLPELREHQQGSRVKMLLVKNFGILAGIAIMFLISVYEAKLV